jgi:DNA mismatch repair protein MutS
MGDFYELFFEDAQKAAAALGITLTARGQHGGAADPDGGRAGARRRGLSRQADPGRLQGRGLRADGGPAEAKRRGSKSVVRRDVVRVVTPGTLTEDGLLDARGANRLAAVSVRAGAAAVASVELSTGEVECLAITVRAWPRRWRRSALRDPGPRPAVRRRGGVRGAEVGRRLRPADAPALAEPGASEARLKRLYGVETLDGFGPLSGAEISALGLIAAHLETTQAGRLPALSAPRGPARPTSWPSTRRRGPAWRSSGRPSGSADGSLLAAIDRTVTAPGRALLAARLARPLLDPPPSTPGWTRWPGSASTAPSARSCARR